MRILAIRGKNLASLEGVFDVDFTVEPLKSAGLFAITGSTGSGKSTILDALCLALFDDVPRFRNASSGEILDSSGKALNQRSSGNILRKGTGDGYAEVDFVALNGVKYRSRWSIKRARGKFDGVLQNVEMSLFNLNDNVYSGGNKTEILSKIVELIGLSFNQFTRAVLLAQGDFATFMKANDNEKAEMLEKLTGTDIYSRVSVGIYDRFKAAEKEYTEVRNIISTYKLLSEEELEELKKKLKAVEDEISTVRVGEEQALGNLNWKKKEILLVNEIKDTEGKLTLSRTALKEASPRFEYISKIDKVQDIRDVWNQYTNAESRMGVVKKRLAERGADLKDVEKKWLAVEKEYNDNEEKYKRLVERYDEIVPEIKRARSMDVEIVEAGKNEKNAVEELEKTKNKRVELDGNIALKLKKIKTGRDNLSKYEKWQTENERHYSVVLKHEVIKDIIAKYKQRRSEAEQVDRKYGLNNQLLNDDESLLLKKQEYFKQLNEALPDEVVILRRKLVDGEPCPVCGSVHHLYSSDVEHDINMKNSQLEDEKRLVKEQMDKLQKAVAENRNEIIRLEAIREEGRRQIESYEADLDRLLESMSNWKQLFNEGSLEDNLDKFVDKWNEMSELKQATVKDIAELEMGLKSDNANLDDIIKEIGERESKVETCTNILAKLKTDRAMLLKGMNADEVERLYRERTDKYNKDKKILLSNRTNLSEELGRISGEVNEMNLQMESLVAESGKLKAEVERWIENGDGLIDYELLKELLSKSAVWIDRERDLLKEMSDEVIAMEARLGEKRDKLELHRGDDSKVGDDETVADLESKLGLLKERLTELNKECSNIALELGMDDKNRESVLKYEKECRAKREIYDDWSEINDLLGSASGDKFKKIAQCYTLEALLSFANKHLEQFSKRYRLERISNSNGDGLGLQVIDEYMYGDIRSVHSLSGGESFLISLALALGLSSLSSNRMSIESLFIDEGFGSLDIETLRVAMSALETLQTQGRKVGVISHVQEMTEQIKVKVRVNKIANGRSNVEITDSFVSC